MRKSKKKNKKKIRRTSLNSIIEVPYHMETCPLDSIIDAPSEVISQIEN